MSLNEIRVVGAMMPRVSRAPFQRTPLVICYDDCTSCIRYQKALRYKTSPPGVEGEALTAADWKALVDNGEATSFSAPFSTSDALRPTFGSWAWVFRQGFALRRAEVVRDLIDCGALAHGRVAYDDFGTYVCIVIEDFATAVRTRWVQQLMAQALENIRNGRSELHFAESAYFLAEQRTPELTALYVYALHTVDECRAAALVTSIRTNEGGSRFIKEMADWLWNQRLASKVLWQLQEKPMKPGTDVSYARLDEVPTWAQINASFNRCLEQLPKERRDHAKWYFTADQGSNSWRFVIHSTADTDIVWIDATGSTPAHALLECERKAKAEADERRKTYREAAEHDVKRVEQQAKETIARLRAHPEDM